MKPDVQFPDWLKTKLQQVHGKPGQGSVFAKPIDQVVELINNTISKTPNISEIANSTGTISTKVPGIGYNLVLKKGALRSNNLNIVRNGQVQKTEGPNTLSVPAVWVSNPASQFATDQLTIIVRPMKDQSGTPIPNKFIILSAFPGDPTIPPASKWDGNYFVVIPNVKQQMKTQVQENLMMENWRRFLNEETDFERQAAAESQKKEYLFNDLVNNTNDGLYEIDWMISDETVSYEVFKKAALKEYANDAEKNPVIIQTIQKFEKNLADKQKHQDMSNADAAGYHTGEY